MSKEMFEEIISSAPCIADSNYIIDMKVTAQSCQELHDKLKKEACIEFVEYLIRENATTIPQTLRLLVSHRNGWNDTKSVNSHYSQWLKETELKNK